MRVTEKIKIRDHHKSVTREVQIKHNIQPLTRLRINRLNNSMRLMSFSMKVSATVKVILIKIALAKLFRTSN